MILILHLLFSLHVASSIPLTSPRTVFDLHLYISTHIHPSPFPLLRTHSTAPSHVTPTPSRATHLPSPPPHPVPSRSTTSCIFYFTPAPRFLQCFVHVSRFNVQFLVLGYLLRSRYCLVVLALAALCCI
ncbi:hypothetical protein K438DRAFT_229737 [Mycena galopus ATCC 62051]|nr:hypothetical protein K438DRAFT_229737 [Mycena galopus ATCC 62051]